MKFRDLTIVLILLTCTTCMFSEPAFADGFDREDVKSLTQGEGAGMSDVEDLFGAPIETLEMAKSDTGCVEAWIFSEVIMKGTKVKAIQMLTVYFDEDGYVCGTYLTDGDKLNEERDRE